MSIGLGLGYMNSGIDHFGFYSDRSLYLRLKTSIVPDVGSSTPTFTRATKAWGFNELGYLEEIASGCAFFGGARLVRNRIVTKSEDFSNAAWAKTKIDVASVVDIPTGYTTAFSLIPTASAGQHYIANSAGAVVPTSTTYRVSVVAKAFGYSHLFFFTANVAAYFNLSTGTVGTVTGTSVASTSINSLGNGWYECVVNCINLTGTNLEVHAVESNGVFNYTADGVSGIKLAAISHVDTTGYDASYVPEYVSVGVVASPYFGAGIDGAKYFETDWQGASIAAANLLGFRIEASAINNLLSSRDLTVQSVTAVTKRWGITDTSGPELVANGTFAADLADWTVTVGAGGAISATGGICTFVSDGSGFTSITNSATLTVGKTYVVTVVASGTGSLKFVSTLEIAGIGNGTSTFSFVATVTGITLARTAGVACNLDIDSISIKEAAVQCALVTGLDGISNTATTLTATAADAIILQPITLASAARCASAYVKRRAGSGTISFTQNGGSSWTDITSLINSSIWSRVQITATLSNPSTGFKISTSGDAIDVDCVQNEAGTFATSPIVTTTAAVTRNASALSYATAFDVAQGTALCSLQSDVPISTSAVVALAGDANARMLRFATDTERDSGEAWDATNTATATGLSVATGIRKRACRWGSDLRMSADGTLGTAESFDGGMGASTTLFVGCNQASAEQISGTISEVSIWPTALTDSQLQQVTR